ncbi:MAG: alpha/beta fold hydrolase [Gemmatimonadaceae bacterium]
MEPDLLRIPVGPGAVHVDRYGHGGSPVVLVHGFGTSSFLWRNVAPLLARQGHTAFALDMFGYGESDRPWDADFGVAAQAEYLDRALTALRVGRPTVVGLGLGGAVALRLAATRPERVSRLVLVNTPAFDLLPGREVRMVQTKTARFALRVSRGVLGAAPLLTPVLRDGVADPAAMPDRLVARYLAPYVGRDGVRHLLVLASSVRGSEVEELALESIATPTLVVWGGRDRWLDSALADRLTATLRDARLVRLPTAGRLVPEEAPDELAALIHDFVSVASPATLAASAPGGGAPGGGAPEGESPGYRSAGDGTTSG